MSAFLKSKKGKIISAAVLIAAVIAILALFLIPDKEKGYRSIRISELSGTVMTENDSGKFAAYENMYLGDGIILSTDSDSYTRMILDSDKYVKLEQLSQAQFVELGSDNNRNTVIRLDKGALTNELVNPLGTNERFVVNTPNAVMSVRGTYFRVEVRYDTNGDAYTDIYTYGGTVACRRVMPDGTIVEEEVLIKEGYKACVKMDEIITIYVEELIEETEDKVDPIDIQEVFDDDVVGIYNASMNGHKMFMESDELWEEIDRRDIDIEKHHSPYDGKKIPRYDEHKEDKNKNNDKHNEKPDEKPHGRPDGEHDKQNEETAVSESAPSEADSDLLSDNADNNEDLSDTPVTEAESSDDNTEPVVTAVPDDEDEYADETAVPDTSYDDSDETVSAESAEDIVSETEASEITEEESQSDESEISESESESVSELTQGMETRTETVTGTTAPTETGTDMPADTTALTESETEESETTTSVTEETTETTTETTEEEPEGIAVDSVNFPDEVFRNYVSTNFDTDSDGYLSDEEIAAVTSIDVSGTSSADGGVTSLVGVENFTALTKLYCQYNTGITSLDVSNNVALTSLTCYNTEVTSLDVSNNTTLTYLNCDNCKLAYIDLTNNTNLIIFNATGNKYPIPANATTFDTSTIEGFDKSKVSNVTGADFNEATGIFYNITGDITYTYNCGQGYTVTFTLVLTA